MKILKDILYKVAIEAVQGSTEVAINNIEFDSRKVSLNDVFVAIKGTQSDGHEFIEKALSLGENPKVSTSVNPALDICAKTPFTSLGRVSRIVHN